MKTRYTDYDQLLTRRTWLGRLASGIGGAALGGLLNQHTLLAAAANSRRASPLHLAPRAKRVIFLCQAGGMSHLETFDEKPKLAAMDGQPMPESFTSGQPIAQLQNKTLHCFGPRHAFHSCGASGQRLAAIFPHLANVADELCIINSARTEQINHDPAHTFMNTGTQISGRPSMGSWLSYGLGSEANDLPNFVVMTSVGGGQSQPIAARQWHSGFLPSRHQGVEFRSTGDPVLYLNDPPGVDRRGQRQVIETVSALNGLYDRTVDDPEIATRITQYEMAFKMQTSVPRLMDLSKETQATLDLYGTRGADGSYAANCLLARRLA